MITIATVRKLALALPGSEEHLHFNLPAFKVNKKIFSTIHEEKKLVMVKLSLVDQSVFCAIDADMIYPVPGGWGRGGATFINLKKIKKDLFAEALTAAWKNTASRQQVIEFFGNEPGS